jgi:hypothetical protein
LPVSRHTIADLQTLIDELASGPTPAQIARLKHEVGDQVAGQLLVTAGLQAKARAKLGDGIWWVTEKSLQQATPWQVARVKADWFGDQPVYDLCCGIGGDSIPLGRRGPLVGIDADPELISLAAANAKAAHVDAGFVCADVRQYPLSSSAAIHMDPDRRRDGRRTSQPDQYQPCWTEVLALIRNAPGAIVKLAPAAKVELAGLGLTHRVWISLNGSVREQSLLCGNMSAPLAASVSSRSAVVLRRDGAAASYLPQCDTTAAAQESQMPLQFMIDPDAAIRAAGLTAAFANQYQLSTLGGPAGFLTGSAAHAVPDGLAIAEPVIWVGASDDRNLRRELRRRNCYPQRIKKRGVDLDPARLQQRLRQCGEQPASLWIGRTGNRQYAVLTKPLPAGPTTANDPA